MCLIVLKMSMLKILNGRNIFFSLCKIIILILGVKCDPHMLLLLLWDSPKGIPLFLASPAFFNWLFWVFWGFKWACKYLLKCPLWSYDWCMGVGVFSPCMKRWMCLWQKTMLLIIYILKEICSCHEKKKKKYKPASSSSVHCLLISGISWFDGASIS